MLISSSWQCEEARMCLSGTRGEKGSWKAPRTKRSRLSCSSVSGNGKERIQCTPTASTDVPCLVDRESVQCRCCQGRELDSAWPTPHLPRLLGQVDEFCRRIQDEMVCLGERNPVLLSHSRRRGKTIPRFHQSSFRKDSSRQQRQAAI
jgi:hypothetical protein